MKGKLALSTLLVTLLSAASIVEFGYAFYYDHRNDFSIDPPEGWAIPFKLLPAFFSDLTKPESFVFSDPSYNYSGATITVVVNQSGLPPDAPFLASRTQGFLWRYLAETYPSYLITDFGARAVSNLNGFETKFGATVDGKEMRFDSGIFVKSNRTFYIICGALSPAYDGLALDFEESINSFRIAPYTEIAYALPHSGDPPQDDTLWVLIGTATVISVSLAPSLIYFYNRKRNRKLHP